MAAKKWVVFRNECNEVAFLCNGTADRHEIPEKRQSIEPWANNSENCAFMGWPLMGWFCPQTAIFCLLSWVCVSQKSCSRHDSVHLSSASTDYSFNLIWTDTERKTVSMKQLSFLSVKAACAYTSGTRHNSTLSTSGSLIPTLTPKLNLTLILTLTITLTILTILTVVNRQYRNSKTIKIHLFDK